MNNKGGGSFQLPHPDYGSRMLPPLVSGADALFLDVAGIIERRKANAINTANAETVLMLWDVGKYINTALLGNKRAEYGKQVVDTLSLRLVEQYGAIFNVKGLRRMMRFASIVDDDEIVATAWRQLSWSHIQELLPIKSGGSFQLPHPNKREQDAPATLRVGG